jgi:hypothetical protein
MGPNPAAVHNLGVCISPVDVPGPVKLRVKLFNSAVDHYQFVRRNSEGTRSTTSSVCFTLAKALSQSTNDLGCLPIELDHTSHYGPTNRGQLAPSTIRW